MNNKIIFLSLLLVTIIGLNSCELIDMDITPKGKFIPKTTNDYYELAGNPSFYSSIYPYVELTTDNVYMTNVVLTQMTASPYGKMYLWKEVFHLATEDDYIWNGAYTQIYNCNVIISNVDASTNGTESEKALIKAETMLNRAYYYWFLVNVYGKSYDVVTSKTDLGVPLLTEPDLEAKVSRATVAEVYNQIVSDLNVAITNLPVEAKNIYRPSKAGAYALFARVSLYMNEYTKAQEYAEKALALNNKLVDYNTYSFINPAKPFSGIKNRPKPDVNPETILYRTTSYNTMLSMLLISQDLLTITGEKDLRFVYGFTRIGRDGLPLAIKDYPYPAVLNEVDFCISVPEMMLIKAECLARANKVTEAVKVLNDLRVLRFKPADYTLLTATTADEALRLVINESRIELFGKGARWFDLKRLNKDTRFQKTIVREWNGTTYTLEPNSNRYLFPIAEKISLINPNIVNNPR